MTRRTPDTAPLVRLAPVLLGTALALVGAVRARRWMASWGSTLDETTRRLPGDDLVPDPLMCVTRSISIEAPASEVWPWIAQIGSSQLGRAGWYSYDRLDNDGVPSADHLLTEVPEPVVGDRLVPDPVDDERCRLVERSWWDIRPRWAGAAFSLVFEPVDLVMMRKHLLTMRDRAEAAHRRMS